MNILLISAHADDIEIGCGGSVVKFLENGERIFWMVFTVTYNEYIPEECLKVMRTLELKEADYKIFDYECRRLPEQRREILQNLVDIQQIFVPDLVICPSLNDLHQDHRTVAYETVRAFKKDASIICYELPWNHITFNSQCFIPLNERQLAGKYELLELYQSQMRYKGDYFSRDFAYGLARARGVQAGMRYAEAFEVVRWRLFEGKRE